MYNSHAHSLGANRCTIRELAEYGSQRAAEIGRENVYDFSIGNPSIPTPAQVDDTIRELLDTMDSVQIHSYTSAMGDLETRQAIARDLNDRYDANVTAERLFLTCGTSPALSSVFQALSVPGGEILTIAPYFSEYKPFVEGAGLQLRVVPPDVPNFQISLPLVEEMLTENTQGIIINSPNNPSGVVYTRETLEKLSALLRKKAAQFGHPIYLIADEPYRELVYDGVEVPFLPTIYPDTIVCYSYSKSLSLPGERIGYVYVSESAADSQALFTAVAGGARALGHICAPSLWQKVIARCAHLRPDLTLYDQNRRRLCQALRSLGYEVAQPDGAFYLFVKAPNGDAVAFSQLAMKKDLLLVPGDDFGCPGYFRLCYCVKAEMIEKSLPIFKELIEN